MRDKHFECFIEEFGEATFHQVVPQAAIEKWRGKLPDQLLHYWHTEGWNGYANGLFWTVNPDDYEDLVDEWLEGSPLEQLDSFHAIARSAFGEIYLWGEKIGDGVSISCTLHALLTGNLSFKSKPDLEKILYSFFSIQQIEYIDEKDPNDEPLFERALAKLGPLGPDEMYGFEPAIVLGGETTLERMRKVKLDPHLTILRQLAKPTMPFADIDFDAIAKRILDADTGD